MAHSRVTEDDVLHVWCRVKAKRQSVRVMTVKFRVGQLVLITKEKIKFVKAAEHNFIFEIFTIFKVIRRRPRAVYELQDLNGMPIDVEFYQKVLTPYESKAGRLISLIKYWTRESDVAFENVSCDGEGTDEILTCGYLHLVRRISDMAKM